jgi:hypothetical protein
MDVMDLVVATNLFTLNLQLAHELVVVALGCKFSSDGLVVYTETN